MRKRGDRGGATRPAPPKPAATAAESRADRFSASAGDVTWFGKMTLTDDPVVPSAAADAAPDEANPAATPDPADRA